MPLYQGKPRFRHEIAWFDYWYIPTIRKVVVCTKSLEPCKMLCYSRKKVKELIEYHKLNPFLLPIMQEALTYFPQEEQS